MSDHKQQRTTVYDIFVETYQRLNIPASKLCEKIGYAPNSYHGWKSTGLMPIVAALACQALTMTQENTTKFVFIRVDSEDAFKTLEVVARGLGLTLNVVGV